MGVVPSVAETIPEAPATAALFKKARRSTVIFSDPATMFLRFMGSGMSLSTFYEVLVKKDGTPITGMRLMRFASPRMK
jgi:hypothetical protein